MKVSLGKVTLRPIITRVVVIFIGLTGLIVIGMELMSFRKGTHIIHQQFSRNQEKQLDLLESELASDIRHLTHIFPAFVKSQELHNKVTETTLVGPYFVYSPQQYGQSIDHWDRVQILKRQIWMVNYFMPLLQSGQLDYLGVYLFDPHNNLIRNSAAPFIELEISGVSFYSYGSKGLFHQLIRHSQTQMENIALSDEYFDQIVYNIGESNTLYSALGFSRSVIPVTDLPQNVLGNQPKIRVASVEKGLSLERSISLQEKIYNWKTKTRESTRLITLVAKKRLDSVYLHRIREKFGSDNLALALESEADVATLNYLGQPLTNSEGNVQANSRTYHYRSRLYAPPPLERPIKLIVFTDENHIDLNPTGIYKSIAVTAIITLFLGLMAWFYFKSNFSQSGRSQPSLPVEGHWPMPPVLTNRPTKPAGERYLLIEDKGKSQTIPLKDVSHIRVADHYCTIFYLQEDQWKSWMIMERLKTFENRYRHLLVKINRSTLVNPERINKIQLLQRKLTMQGEPDFLLTISQSALERIKAITASNPGLT